jgi:hypothetical protein
MANYLPIYLSSSGRRGSWHSPQDQSAHGLTCLDSSLVTSRPHAQHQESTGTWPTLYRRRESPSRSLSSTFATRGTSHWRSMINPSSCSLRRDSEEMFRITNRYALAEEETLDTRDQKKDATQISPTPRRVTTRRGSQFALWQT